MRATTGRGRRVGTRIGGPRAAVALAVDALRRASSGVISHRGRTSGSRASPMSSASDVPPCVRPCATSSTTDSSSASPASAPG